MKILGLDISKHTGFSVLEDGKIIESGTYDVDDPEEFKTLLEEVRYNYEAQDLARFIYGLYLKHDPDVCYLEQINRGKNRHSQKMLDGLHYAIIEMFINQNWIHKVRYVDTSAWRNTLSVRLNKDQAKHNKQVKQKLIRGKITPKHLAVMKANEVFGLRLKLKDNNTADSLMLGLFGVQDVAKNGLPVKYVYPFNPGYDSLQDRIDQS
jgi:hypothetical protein